VVGGTVTAALAGASCRAPRASGLLPGQAIAARLPRGPPEGRASPATCLGPSLGRNLRKIAANPQRLTAAVAQRLPERLVERGPVRQRCLSPAAGADAAIAADGFGLCHESSRPPPSVQLRSTAQPLRLRHSPRGGCCPEHGFGRVLRHPPDRGRPATKRRPVATALQLARYPTVGPSFVQRASGPVTPSFLPMRASVGQALSRRRFLQPAAPRFNNYSLRFRLTELGARLDWSMSSLLCPPHRNQGRV
jgi:hypothetical protein